jgi:hypothetical protein
VVHRPGIPTDQPKIDDHVKARAVPAHLVEFVSSMTAFATTVFARLTLA